MTYLTMLCSDPPCPPRGGEGAAEYAKLPTGKLAAKLGLQSARLYDKLIGSGYIEVCEVRKAKTRAENIV